MKRVLVLVISIFIAGQAFAQTVANDLIGLGMKPEQADYLAGILPAGSVLGNATYLKGRNQANSADINMLAIDAGDNTVVNSSASDELILQLEDDASRLIRFTAASDAALAMKFGDAGTTATQILTLSASTSDADDDSTIIIAGGGANGGTRGASITLPGEEVSGGSDITYNAGTSDTHIFQIAGTTYETISSSGTTLPVANTYLTVLDGIASVPADVTDVILGSQLSSVALGTSTSGTFNVIQTGAASTGGSGIALMKSRAVDGTADTIVGNGDTLGLVTGYGADGAAYVTGGRLAFVVSAAPGTNDMPTDMVVSLSPDGSATLGEAMRVTQAKAIVGQGEITSASTGSLGWSYVTGANTACTTTCTSAAVFGVDLAAGASQPVIVGPSSATADACVCAGAS